MSRRQLFDILDSKIYALVRATKNADACSSRVEKGFEGGCEERCGFFGKDEYHGLFVSVTLVQVSDEC